MPRREPPSDISLYIETLGFRALVLHHCGEDAAGLAQEAVELAKVYGLPRVFEDAHPALGERIVRICSRDPAGDAPSAAPRRAPAVRRDAEAEFIARSTALTPKEREVLELLARNLSNKEIGLTMNIHEDTVKWHVKNLFAKLSAGTRKQVVSRARLTGSWRDSGAPAWAILLVLTAVCAMHGACTTYAHACA